MLIRSRLASIAAVELDGLVHRLERDPGAGEARHRPAVEPVVENLLHPGRVQDRNHHVDEVVFGLVRGGRRFGGVVVAHQRQHAAVFRGAGQIGMAENVAGAIDAGALAVPHGEDAVVFAFAAQLRLLRAPDRSGGEVFVDAALKADVALGQERCGALELTVETAERRTAITGDVARGIEAVAAVKLFLHQAEPHQGLEPGDEDVAVAEIVFVVELDVAQRHQEWPSTVAGGQSALPVSILPEGRMRDHICATGLSNNANAHLQVALIANVTWQRHSGYLAKPNTVCGAAKPATGNSPRRVNSPGK